MDVTIRRAGHSDADAVTRVFRESRFAARGLVPQSSHTLREDEWFVSEVLLRQRETWVAVAANNDVLAMMTLNGDWLDQLYVYSTLRRSGLGSQLVEVAKRERPNGLQLWTFRTNTPAQRFYEKHGFTAVEETDGSRNEDRAPDIRYVWKRDSNLPAVITVETARRVAGELLDHDLDLVWDQEWLETADAWAIVVNSQRYYMTRLDRHRLQPPRFVVVPKDGSAPSIASEISGDVIGRGDIDDVARFPRIPDNLLFYSQPAAVWREWLPQLRYFRLEVVRPRDDGRDQFVARFICDDEVDAAARLARFGVATRVGDEGLEFATTAVPGFIRRMAAPTIDGVRVELGIGAPGKWTPGRRTVTLSFSLRAADDPFRITEADLANALHFEKRFDELGWQNDLDPTIRAEHVITREHYPDLFG